MLYMEKVEITEANVEEMCRLAEDVVQELYMNFQSYDAEGRDILSKYESMEGDFQKEILPLVTEEKKKIMDEDPSMDLLYNLFRRGDNIGAVEDYTLVDIRPWIEPILPKALKMFRLGTKRWRGEANYVAAKSVPDDYLAAIFAREVRNMMMIFAGQTLHEECSRHYLLLLEADGSRDGDEWVGVYYDNGHFREVYESVSAELQEKREYYKGLHLAIYEFIPDIERPVWDDLDGDGGKKKAVDYGTLEPRQKIRPIEPGELRCFKKREREKQQEA